MKKFLFSLGLITSILSVQAQVTTIAGTGSLGFADGPGTAAQFYNPNGIVVDKAGNIYVGDLLNHRIRKITPSGVVSTFAGTGILGYKDGPVATAQFNEPWGLTIDGSGNIYVGDAKNNLIRKITPAGIVSTLAGSGISGFADGVGTAASFAYPSAMGIDAAGNVYVGDCDNQRVRKVTPAGVVTTVAGNGVAGYADGPAASAQFYTPNCMAVTASGDIYVTDVENSMIRKISGGVVSTFAGSSNGYADGKGTAAKFFKPHGIVLDTDGNLFVCDNNNNCIRKITPDGTVTTVAGTTIAGFKDGAPGAAQFYGPKCITKDINGNLYVTDELNYSIRKLNGFVTGLNNYQLSSSALFPNPTKDIINLKCTVSGKQAELVIYNITGQVVLKQSVATPNQMIDTKIDLSTLEQGNYWLNVSSGDRSESQMITKY